VIAFGWRQFRDQATVGLIGLVVIGVVLLATGPHLVNVYDTAVAACKASGGLSSACNNPVSATFHGLQIGLMAVVLIVPALIGMFWGAPLIAHELETGTFRLAWTQSVSRLRWFGVKLGLVGLASFVAAGLLSLMATWWFAPIDMVGQDRFGGGNFGVHGFVPGGYAVFAFALGATAGLLIRRTLPAMAVTLGGFIAVRIAVTNWVRPHYMSPVSLTEKLTQANTGFQLNGPIGAPGTASVVANTPDLPNAWVQGATIVNGAGQAPSSALIKHDCPSLVSGVGPAGPLKGGGGGGPFSAHASVAHTSSQAQQAFTQCFTALSTKYHEVVSYQPASRFWTFQAIETVLFIALAVVLAGGCAWWVRHRIS
jgi:ABC-2 family transporter protein